MVKCEGCDRWVDLEATPFEALEEAEASRYRCALCIKIEVLQEILENALMKAKEEWREREEYLKTLFEEEKTLRTAEQAKREKLEKQIAELTNTLEAMQGETRKERRPPSPHMMQEGERRIQETDREEDTAPEAKGESVVPTTAGQERAQDNRISPGRQEDNTTSPGCQDTEPRWTRVPTQPTGQKRAGSTPMRPPKGVKREIIVAGDGNVGRFASALVQEVGVKDSVEFLYQRGATVDQTHEAIREYEGQARKIPRKYVLHLGLNEVLQGTVEDLTAKLEETWKGRGAELVICSIPEVSSRGKEMQADAAKANARIRAMCVRIKARFLDMEPVLNSRCFTKEGTLYSNEGVQRVTKKIAGMIASFLGQQTRQKTPRNASEGRKLPSVNVLWDVLEQLVKSRRNEHPQRSTGHRL
ncbi:unnamed protein product [Ixodes pacificus]